MNIIFKIFALIVSIPARLKGMRFGKDSYIGPGYDWLFVSLKNIRLGDRVLIGRNSWLQTMTYKADQAVISIGDDTHIGRRATISAAKKIKVGKRCLISYDVSILDHNHSFNLKKGLLTSGKIDKPASIVIGDDCFIGAHSFILKGVIVGDGCVVGANSVVTKSFPKGSRISGNPAQNLVKKKEH